MSCVAHFRGVSLIAFTCVVVAVSASRAQSQSPVRSSAADSQAQAELVRILAGIFSDTSSHMRMGPTRPATAADSARAATIVVAARAALTKYVDVNVAERDGYYRNMPWLEDQPIYHYNSARNFSAAAQGEFDVTKPVSLLYKKDDRGQLRLLGAMYATNDSAAPERLDALLPISMAHWHEHVNLCYPGAIAARFLPQPQKVNATTVFLFKFFLSATSAKECELAGGQFVLVEGDGWMAHVYLFTGSDDPKLIWDADDLGNMDPHMRHPPMATPR